jgi:hypothetical protein
VSIITTNAAGQTTVTLEPYETLAKDDGQLLIVERPPRPNIDHLITEDDTPVDNLSSAVQQRLLVEPLYTTWKGGNPPQPLRKPNHAPSVSRHNCARWVLTLKHE